MSRLSLVRGTEQDITRVIINRRAFLSHGCHWFNPKFRTVGTDRTDCMDLI
nr:MAG TPA: hypothetical protein [Caudoviricetes sp.]